jgi:nucleotide-binding universal stress UspA family protein
MGNLSELRHLQAVPGQAVRRLLLPIDASEESSWGVRHAVRLAEAGEAVEVCLIYVAEPVLNWEELRFRSPEEVREHFRARSSIFLARAAASLAAAGIPCQTDFHVLGPEERLDDLASALHCSEIVVPRCRWLGVFPYGPWRRLTQPVGAIPVTETSTDGLPV